MNRFLFAWELGANFGHLARLTTIARVLKDRGHTVLFVIRDLQHAQAFLMKQGIDFIGAPFFRMDGWADPNKMPASYADILALQGFDRLDIITPQVAAWHVLFDLFRPDAVILDFAPVAMFAAQLAGLPRMALGTGFTLPPLRSPFPSFRRISIERNAALLETEQRIAHTLDVLSQQHQRPAIHTAADIFRGTERLFVTLPELDHYGPRREAHYIGLMPQFRSIFHVELPGWPHGRKRILVYLHPSYLAIDNVLRALTESGHAVIICIPNATQTIHARTTAKLNIVTSLVDTAALIPQADLVITHGGHGMVGEALMAGKPLLVLPRQLEQSLLAQRVASLGIGIALGPDHLQSTCVASIAALIEENVYGDAARTIRTKYSVSESETVLNQIVHAIELIVEA